MDAMLGRADDHVAIKDRTRAQWDNAATGWDRHESTIGRWLMSVTAAMIDLAGVGPGSTVIDLAAGNGAQTAEIADRVGLSGRVVATDLSPVSVSIAARRLEAAKMYCASAIVADSEALPFDDGSFDAATCRLGLMFLPRPSVGLSEMRRVLRPGGRAASVVFSRADRNPCITTLMKIATKHAGTTPPDPARPGGLLSLGVPNLLSDLYGQAGFSRVCELVVSAPFHLPSASAYVEFVRDGAAPVIAILSRLSEDRQRAAYDEIEREFEVFKTDAGWEGPNELLIVWGEA